MITRNQIVDLLSAMAAYDNRNPAAASVLAWGEAAERGRWTFDEALDAVHTHYVHSAEFALPVHINQLIRTKRQDAAMREPVTPADPIGQARVTKAIIGAFQTIGDTRDKPWMQAIATAKREAQERRKRVLAHPDLAEKLTHPPLNLADPLMWNGYIPPKTLPGDDANPYDEVNQSPIRRQLVDIAAEALRRETGTAS